MFLTTGEVALGSAVLGAALTYGATWAQSRREDRRRSEDKKDRERERWLNEKRMMYATFLAEIESHARDLWKYSASHRIGPPNIEKQSVTWGRIDRSMDVTEQVQLIAPETVGAAAREALSALSGYVVAMMDDGHSEEDSQTGIQEVTLTLAKFRDLARADLGVADLDNDRQKK